MPQEAGGKTLDKKEGRRGTVEIGAFLVSLQRWLVQQLLDPVLQVLDTRARLEFPANALGARSFHPWEEKNYNSDI